MTNLQKALLGVGAVASVAAVAYVVKKQTENVYADLTRDENNEDEVKEEKRDIPNRIKEAADKKTTEILAWVIIHREQIEAASTVLGIAGATLSIVNAVREYKRGDETADKINEIYEFCQVYASAWCETEKANMDAHDEMSKALLKLAKKSKS